MSSSAISLQIWQGESNIDPEKIANYSPYYGDPTIPTLILGNPHEQLILNNDPATFLTLLRFLTSGYTPDSV